MGYRVRKCIRVSKYMSHMPQRKIFFIVLKKKEKSKNSFYYLQFVDFYYKE